MRKLLGPLLGITLLTIAVIVLGNKMSALDLSEVWTELKLTPLKRTLGALLLTAVYYLLVTGYDILAFSVIRTPLKISRIALASFTGYVCGHNIGLSSLVGGSVRFRIHSCFGLSAKETAKIVAFIALSFWVGALAMGSFIFLLNPYRIPSELGLPFKTAQPLGWLCLILLIFYVWIVVHALHGRKIGSLELPHLTPAQVVLQMLIGAADFLIGSSILFLLLPHARVMGFPDFLQAYMLAYIAGLSSQVPGGIGVFEGVLVFLIPAAETPAATVSALILYRLIFYVIPLVVAVILLAVHELRIGRGVLTGK
ncbi:hypothetical protein A3A67_03375 [Candidatus Peribacteria bacterium RIFCSPLOWO2_01_FULL_51_18]|nr:MAG: hypothetical protein A3C52_04625 [Candidatus Peribacteria bacterium RIFCSPHIGHO2_02_FULL_51_15]OGJ65771.1 MAG: hypothetical protein A3A67_03375 [Candidatus Peribacteria bacterium RIFCSPLOWO2_01_FULL_51_18]OGJ68559.1 MAG: hypothetical protein A3J34_03725 [Candidatus Peribacteria bacterium RIFCSPLOWO2_02_FULL_51_10]